MISGPSRLLGVAVTLIVGAACSLGQTAATPTGNKAPHQPYVVLLQGDPTPTHVAIVDLSGNKIAGTDFDAGGTPRMCGGYYIRPPIARIVAGNVYFVDHSGSIRRLDVSGKSTEVMRLPITSSQQQPYFAVSPDGASLMASVVTVVGINPNATSLGDCPDPNGRYGVENFIGSMGSTPRSLGPGEFKRGPTVVAGWDATGPLGTNHTDFVTNGVPPGGRFAGENLVRLDPGTGATVGAPFGGSDCRPVDRLVNGTLLCRLANDDLAVRRADGSTDWTTKPPTGSVGFTPALAPDANHIGVEGAIVGRGGKVDSTPPPSPGQFMASFGWVDADTVVTGDLITQQQLVLVRVSSPGTPVSFPAKGTFVGVLATT